LVDETVADLEEIEQDLAVPEPSRHERQHLITDAIAEMEWWASFHPEDSLPSGFPDPPPPVSPPPGTLTSGYVRPQPFVREPKIGRNDPCPCGSGRKYKKCCGKG
jgi:preprotein translocase subunit SecA